MIQKSVAFETLETAERDAIFILARDGAVTITECNCYEKTRWYVGTKPMPQSRRHNSKKHRELKRVEKETKK